jgi:outer membrane murein-binding lipoprotein Lpp
VPLVFAAIAGAVVLIVLIVAYRRHRVAASIAALNSANAQLERDREYRERFTAAAAQVGDEKATTQLAGVRAMAELADD